MFVRRIDINLKPNVMPDFKRTMEGEVLPMLRKQEGFLHQMTFLRPETTQGFGLSMWKTKDAAETYNRTVYPQIMKTLERYFEGVPQVQNFEMTNSTLNLVPAVAKA